MSGGTDSRKNLRSGNPKHEDRVYRKILKNVPVYIITNPDITHLGCAYNTWR